MHESVKDCLLWLQIMLWGSSYERQLLFNTWRKHSNFSYINFWMDCSLSFLNNLFHKKISKIYDLRNHKELYSRNPKTVRYGTETVSYMASKIWSKVPETIKMSSSLWSFKSKIQKWKPECDCGVCTTYLHHVGFVNVF